MPECRAALLTEFRALEAVGWDRLRDTVTKQVTITTESQLPAAAQQLATAGVHAAREREGR